LGDITENFDLTEFGVSDEFPNLAREITFSKTDCIKIFYLCRLFLQPLRTKLNWPVLITSGKRSRPLNKLVGGARTSDHLFKQESAACDFKVIGHKFLTRDAFDWIKDKRPKTFGQLILYYADDDTPSFVHISLPSKKHLGEVLVKMPNCAFITL